MTVLKPIDISLTSMTETDEGKLLKAADAAVSQHTE